MIITDLTWLLGEIANPDDVVVEPVQEEDDPKRKLENATQDDLIRETRKLREEAKKRRLEADQAKKEAEAYKKQIEDSQKQAELDKLTEVEKEKALREEALKARDEAEKRASDAVKFVEDMVRNNAVESVANELGFRNPKLAIKLYGDLGDIDIADGLVADMDKIKEKLNTILATETYLKKTDDTTKPKSPEQIKEPINVRNPAGKPNDEELLKQQEQAMQQGDGTKALSFFLKRNDILPK